ncbi:MAG: class I SAM-dependent methyltransferase [Dehalococcoidales bacterium]|nr:class I SAM-dependent methyltransferase [Dehalococcoidales bacterium]
MKQGIPSKYDTWCPICKNTSGIQVVEEVNSKDTSSYDICYCPNCRGEFSRPMKPMNYENAIDTANIDYGSLLSQSLRRNYSYSCMVSFLDTIEKSEILDIGAGLGIFLTHAHNLGFRSYGVDTSRDNIDFLNTRLPFATFAVIEDAMALPLQWPKSFKVISALDVFEHVAKPFELGKQIYSILSPGGYFLMSLPNLGRYYYRLGRIIDDFIIENKDEPPYHLTRWRIKTVQTFLKSIGFKECCIVTGGLLWRKNISVKGTRSGLLSSIPRSLYKLSPYMPLALIKVIESLGTHFIVFARKDGDAVDKSLKYIEKKVLKKVYRRRIPFFIESEIV